MENKTEIVDFEIDFGSDKAVFFQRENTIETLQTQSQS